MRLYYFTSEQYGIRAILTKLLKVSRFDTLNDPFELLALELPEREWRKQNRLIKRRIAERYGIICMCRTWKNPLLWSHYAEHHKGICLGFDVSESEFKKVNYREERLTLKELGLITPNELNESHFDKIIYNKFDNWNYEDEYRAKVSLSESIQKSGHSFVQFSDEMMLREVKIGTRCSLGWNSVEKLLKSYKGSVSHAKVRPSFKDFEIVENKQWGNNPKFDD